MKPSAQSVEIGSANPAESGAIQALLRQADLPADDFMPHLPNFLVARRQGAVIGAIGYELLGVNALLRSLVVAPTCRGSGIGDVLVQRLADRAEAAGLVSFFLLTTTAEDFFTKRGFRRIERDRVPAEVTQTEEFKELCPSSAVVMERRVCS